jgi:hypothetical protein
VNIELETPGQTTLVMPQGRLDFASAPVSSSAWSSRWRAGQLRRRR